VPKSTDSWGRPYGSDRDRRLVWTGTVVILVGAILIGAAVIVLNVLWLWIVAAVLVIVGVVLLAVGRPHSTSRVPR
jgi:fatty acid desaturase